MTHTLCAVGQPSQSGEWPYKVVQSENDVGGWRRAFFGSVQVLKRTGGPRRAAARDKALHLKLLLVGQERSFPVQTHSKCALSMRRAISPLSIRVRNIFRNAVQCAKHCAKLHDACASCQCCLKRLNHPPPAKWLRHARA